MRFTQAYISVIVPMGRRVNLSVISMGVTSTSSYAVKADTTPGALQRDTPNLYSLDVIKRKGYDQGPKGWC